MAPVPNAICKRCANPEDFMSDSSGSSIIDFGRFFTGFLVVTGLALPIMLAHSQLIVPVAMYMSIAGGILIYITIISFTMFFQDTEDF